MRRKFEKAISVRVLSVLTIAALAAVLSVFYTSLSTDGAVMGKWSVPLAAVMAVCAIGIILALLALTGLFRFHMKVLGFLRGFPEFAAPFLLVILPLLLFLTWFLGLTPLLENLTFTAGAVVLVFLPGAFLLFSNRGKEFKNVAIGLFMMIFTLAAMVVLGEILFRNIMPEQIFNPRFGLRPYSRTEIQVDLEGVSRGGILSTNMWGLRGEDPPEDWDDYLTILTVGGSTTANYYLDDALTWSNILQETLREQDSNVWVGNAGIPRHSAETHLLFLREVGPMIDPDMVIFLVGVNDLGPFLRGDRYHEERLPDTGPREWLFRNSMILQLIYKAKKVHIDGAPVVTATADPEFQEIPMAEPEDSLPDDLHELLADPDFFSRRVTMLIEECRRQGFVPVFLTQPLLYQDDEYWRGIQETARFFQGTDRPISAATFALMVETLNHDLIQVCEEQGVAVFDLAAEIPHHRDYFYDAMHMTEVGAELVGSVTGAFILNYLEEELIWPED